LSSFAGADPALNAMLLRAARLAETRVPLVLEGETGTGKERLARAVHVCGPADRALHVVRCACVTAAQITEHADAPAGTIFLKGLEDLGAAEQAALLALLERREDLRPVASCRRDLARAVREGAFRADLYFRIAGDTLRLPPLRLRHDLDWLIDRVLRRHNARGLSLSPAARADLGGRDWPGNIRELESVIDVAAAVAEGKVIDLPDLPAPCLSEQPTPGGGDDLEALLDACGWNMARVAKRLGVNRSTILRRVRKAGLSAPG
uniref:sigma 54-interacting transcriptional regulator n=1 Tax=Roseovarius halophilus (ex Wu et al. 2025) TaxID=3376060 RepID=UPI00399C1C57